MLALFFILTACGSRQDLAPVTELKWSGKNANVSRHKVRYGETLYSVAFLYDQDYRKLAQRNRLKRPYALKAGQLLNILSSDHISSGHMLSKKNITFRSNNRVVAQERDGFLWPIHGKILKRFSPRLGSKGINISGHKLEPVRAAAKGVVAYAGSGIAGYGQLIIIKHNDQLLTAYGNNAVNVVREGQHVRAGQVIGKVGSLDRRHSGLHFEIRQAGRPVNPLIYMPNR